MNFSVYVDDDLLQQFNRLAKESGRTRNALIREALQEWIARRKRSRWPQEVLKFKGVKRMERFEQNRKLLKPPRDPFDEIPA